MLICSCLKSPDEVQKNPEHLLQSEGAKSTFEEEAGEEERFRVACPMSQVWVLGLLMKRLLDGQWSTSASKARGLLGSGTVWVWRETCFLCDPGPD